MWLSPNKAPPRSNWRSLRNTFCLAHHYSLLTPTNLSYTLSGTAATCAQQERGTWFTHKLPVFSRIPLSVRVELLLRELPTTLRATSLRLLPALAAPVLDQLVRNTRHLRTSLHTWGVATCGSGFRRYRPADNVLRVGIDSRDRLRVSTIYGVGIVGEVRTLSGYCDSPARLRPDRT